MTLSQVPTQITYLKFLKSVCFNEAGCEYYQTLYPSATPFLNLSLHLASCLFAASLKRALVYASDFFRQANFTDS